MSRSLRWATVVLVAWTAYVWVTRLVNAWSGDEATSAKVASSVVSAIFLGLAAAAAVVVVRTWRAPLTPAMGTVLLALCAWTVGVWAVRVVTIALADHDLGFKVVHAALGVVSMALAALVARGVSSDRRAVPGRAGPASTAPAPRR